MVARHIGTTGGTLDKFMGDGVIALYGDFEDIADISNERSKREIITANESAITAGLKIAEEFYAIAKDYVRIWRLECPEINSREPIGIGIAVHTGKPMVGLYGAKALTGEHIMYTAIGRDVNLAQRIGNGVEGQHVWISMTSWEWIRDIHDFDISPDAIVLDDLKGISAPIEAFQVDFLGDHHS